jgi:hypothetical protein
LQRPLHGLFGDALQPPLGGALESQPDLIVLLQEALKSSPALGCVLGPILAILDGGAPWAPVSAAMLFNVLLCYLGGFWFWLFHFWRRGVRD